MYNVGNFGHQGPQLIELQYIYSNWYYYMMQIFALLAYLSSTY